MRTPTPFGKYLLLERINIGGMAEVFLGKSSDSERIVAIKRILPTMLEDAGFVTMFLDEARISVQLNHPNIVEISDLGRFDDTYFIAMEYVSGKDLRQLFENYRRFGLAMPVAQACYIVSKVCEGLDYAHKKRDADGTPFNIVHRDVSPQNVLVSYDGDVKLIDFGIAKTANRGLSTQAGILKGKFGYMSPEQVCGRPIDRRSDIFAVGIVLYELLTGERLFTGESDYAILEKVRSSEIAPPRQVNSSIPVELEKIVLKALARPIEERYQWCSDLKDDLSRFVVENDAPYTTKSMGMAVREMFARELAREEERLLAYASVSLDSAVPEFNDVDSMPSYDEVRGSDFLDRDNQNESEPRTEIFRTDQLKPVGGFAEKTAFIRPSDSAVVARRRSSEGLPAFSTDESGADATLCMERNPLDQADGSEGNASHGFAESTMLLNRDGADSEQDDEPSTAPHRMIETRIASKDDDLSQEPSERRALQMGETVGLVGGGGGSGGGGDETKAIAVGNEAGANADEKKQFPRKNTGSVKSVPRTSSQAGMRRATKTVRKRPPEGRLPLILAAAGIGLLVAVAVFVLLRRPRHVPPANIAPISLDQTAQTKGAPTESGASTQAGPQKSIQPSQLEASGADAENAAKQEQLDSGLKEPTAPKKSDDVLKEQPGIETALTSDSDGKGESLSKTKEIRDLRDRVKRSGRSKDKDGEKAERTDRLEKPDRVEKVPKRERVEKSPVEKLAKPERSEKAEKVAKAEKTGDESRDGKASKKAMGKLITISAPVARVVIDGKDTGLWTPISLQNALELAPGEHNLVYIAADGRKASRKVTITGNEVAKITGVDDFK